MAKSIIKEIFIILLVCVAIVLITAVIFYNYIPTNKIVPAKVTAYQTPENIQTEIIEDTIGNYTTQEERYTVEDTDLNKYKQTQSYNPGKPDPFKEYVNPEVSGNEVNQENQNTSSNNTSEVDKNTTNNYYTSQNVNKGTK